MQTGQVLLQRPRQSPLATPSPRLQSNCKQRDLEGAVHLQYFNLRRANERASVCVCMCLCVRMHHSVCYFYGAQRGHRSPLVYTYYLRVIVFALLCLRTCLHAHVQVCMCVCVCIHIHSCTQDLISSEAHRRVLKTHEMMNLTHKGLDFVMGSGTNAAIAKSTFDQVCSTVQTQTYEHTHSLCMFGICCSCHQYMVLLVS